MRRVPESEALLRMLIGLTGPIEESPEHDRTAAIVGATFLEYALRKAVTRHFRPDPKDSGFNYLFEHDDAPYREFATRTRLAKALGVIGEDEYVQLEAIRHIRNAFAHTMEPVTFDTPEIANFFEEFTLQKKDDSFQLLVDIFSKSDSLLGMLAGRRRLFVHAVFLCYWKLINYPPLPRSST